MRTSAFEIRPGEEADRPAAAEMIRSRAAWMRQRGLRWASWDRRADQLAGQIGTGRWPVFVLTRNDQVVGMTTATSTLPHLGWTEDEVTEPSVFLQTTVTDPSFAGAGLGVLIAYWALDYAAINGKRWTRRGVLTVGKDNHGLVRYYELQGWRVVRAVPHPRKPGVVVWSLQRPAAPQPELRELVRCSEPHGVACGGGLLGRFDHFEARHGVLRGNGSHAGGH